PGRMTDEARELQCVLGPLSLPDWVKKRRERVQKPLAYAGVRGQAPGPLEQGPCLVPPVIKPQLIGVQEEQRGLVRMAIESGSESLLLLGEVGALMVEAVGW